MTVLPRLVVPAAVLLLLLAGCAAPTPGGTGAPDPVTTESDSAETDAPSAEPVPAPDCEAVRVGFEQYAASLGAGMSFGFADPAHIVAVHELPADVLAFGCYIQDPLNENSAWALIIDPDESVSDQLSQILAVDHTAGESDDFSSTWESDADSVTVSGPVTVDNAEQAHLTTDILAAFNGAAVTSVVVSAYL